MRRTKTALAATTALSVAAVAAVTTAGIASAATTSALTLTGGANTHTAGSVLYVKEGGALTLSAATSAAKCVVATNVGGAVFATALSSSNSTTQTSWTLTGAGVAGDGSKSISVVAYDNRNCSQGAGAASTTSYTAANTAPSLTGAVVPAAGTAAAQNGWYRGDVQVTWTCASVPTALGLKSDGGCATSSLVQGEGANLSATKTVTDNVGNQKSTTVSGIKIDGTAPTTSVSSEPSGWYSGSQTFTLVPGTDLSGVASTHYTVNGGAQQTGTSVIVSGEGTHVVRYWSVDVAGNVETAKEATVRIDETDPTILSSQSPEKNGANWNNTNVVVSFQCEDAGGSELASCTEDQTVTTEGEGQLVQGHGADNAGRTASTTHVVSIDKTDPTIEATADRAAPNSGWYTADVTVSFTCEDNEGGSGIASCPDAQVIEEGGGQSVTRGTADLAGNGDTTTLSGINVDKTPPTTESNAPTGWQTDAVTVNLSASDQLGLSGVDYAEYRVNGGDWTAGATISLTDDGVYVLEFRSVDVAGNEGTVETATVSIDSTVPTVTDEGTTAVANEHGWHNDAVANSFAATDNPGSGLADEAQADFEVSSGAAEGEGVTIQSGAVSDVAGNTNDGISSATFNIDLTPPDKPTISGIAAREYVRGSVPLPLEIICASYDALSTLASCDIEGYGSTAGSYTLTATATDKAGNTNTETLAYTVVEPAKVWAHDGFHNPIGKSNTILQGPTDAGAVATPPPPTSSTVWNVAKGGSTIPLKFNLKINGVEQTSIGTDVISKFNATKITCPGGTVIGEVVEEVASSGTATGLRYVDGQYIQNWKTSSVSSDTCYRVALTTADNSVMYTFVRLRK